MRLSGKVAIVTGATKGVGRGIAQRFAEAGAKVVLAGRTEKTGRDVEREILESGGQAMFVRTDLSVEADCRALVEATEEQFGALTTLVNNAAATHLIGSNSPIADNRMHLLKNETMDAMWGSDLYGLFWTCRYALRAMLKHHSGGSIINISSGVAFGGGGDMDAYAASKGAMQAITRSMAGEYAASRIRVNAIVLGLINNGGPVMEMLKDPQLTAAMQATIPLPMVGEPDDIAWGAVYLASDESRYVTGAALPIDGGAQNTRRNDALSGTGWAAPRS
jgi:NAD(P)-dependent dehydrogenase (short-subunit alcohol dehydrogenase family)